MKLNHFFFWIFNMSPSVHDAIKEIKSVAVIGGGPSGSGSAKALLRERKFTTIKIFEKRPDFGGLWNYTAETDALTTPVPSESATFDVKPILAESGNYIWASPVYDYLDTNVPKDIMTYAETPFPEDLPVFPHRSDVLKYLREYAAELEPYIVFGTKVVEAIYVEERAQWRLTSRKVCVETKGGSVASQESGFQDVVEHFDAVVIATGNYDIPYIPNRPGMAAWNDKYPGTITHVKSFRNPQQFADEKGKVVIVGNSASAGDLAYQLATELNRTIYKSKRSENLLPAGQTDLIVDVPDIERFDADSRTVFLTDGSSLEDVGKVVFATGYLKSFPFLKVPEGAPPLLSDGHKCHGTYQHVILYHYPNLAIIGLARYVLPTRTAETQGCWLAKIWSNRVQLPSFAEMQKWEADRETVKGNGKQFHDLLYPEDVKYCNFLNQQILHSVRKLPVEEQGLLPKVWDKEQTALRGSIKLLKEAYIQYKARTGKLARSYQELIDANVIDKVVLTDEDLREKGFDFA